MQETIINIGDNVVCDLCNTDYTESDEQGGFIFGSHAVCPTCAPRMRASIRECKEEHFITAECPAGISFREFVLNIRNGDNTIRIQTFDSHEDFNEHIR